MPRTQSSREVQRLESHSSLRGEGSQGGGSTESERTTREVGVEGGGCVERLPVTGKDIYFSVVPGLHSHSNPTLGYYSLGLSLSSSMKLMWYEEQGISSTVKEATLTSAQISVQENRGPGQATKSVSPEPLKQPRLAGDSPAHQDHAALDLRQRLMVRTLGGDWCPYERDLRKSPRSPSHT